MNVDNQTSQDIYFGPLHLPANATGFYVDDTTATSLYLTNDAVADALNNAYNAGKIHVTGQAQPFPRPTGTPVVLHGTGDPEGVVFAAQGSIYLRRDALQSNGGGIYIKTSGITFSTLWLDLPTAAGVTVALPPGTLACYGGASPPSGWLLCDGAAVSRTVYGLLFTAISTLYGAGDGSTTFNVPDFRGRVPVGYAASGGNTVVATLGLNEGVALANRRPMHRHTPHVHSVTARRANAPNASTNAAGNLINLDTFNTASADGGSGVSTDSLDAPAYLVVNYIIKT